MLEISPILCFLAIFGQHRVGLLERLPALHRVGQEARSGRLQRPAELLGDLDRGAAQHLGVQLVGAGLDLLLDLVEERDQLVALDREAVALGLGAERLEGAGVPVDQGAVDVEGHKRDCFRNRHGALMMPWRCAGVRAAPVRAGRGLPARSIECTARAWICSSTRASSCSRATACPFPPASPRAPSRRRSPPPTRSATRARSRPRSRSAAAASSAGSRSPTTATRPRSNARGDPRDGHPRAHRPRAVDRGRLARSPPSTTPRSCSTARPRRRW